jgi:hypothetical protein
MAMKLNLSQLLLMNNGNVQLNIWKLAKAKHQQLSKEAKAQWQLKAKK